MTICKKCLVELDEGMKQCPLCGTPSGENPSEFISSDSKALKTRLLPGEKHLVQRILWQIITILLFSGIIATLIIDLSINKKITWSIFPIALCMIVFSYASLLAFWHTKTIYKIMGGWALSTFLLLFINYLLPDIQWASRVGIPILMAVNVISIALIGVINFTKEKGLNLLAYTFVAIAILCIAIEGIISHYRSLQITLRWSIIVAACLLPVTAALVFMFHRTKNNSTLQKIFHT